MIKYLGHEITWVPTINKGAKVLYLEIARAIEQDIASGLLATGTKLPSQRLIANYLGLNHSTVTKAYKVCEQKGLIKGLVGKGTFVNNIAGIPATVLSEERDLIADMGMLHPLYETNGLLEEMLEALKPHLDREIMYRYSGACGHPKHKHIASKWLKTMGIQAVVDQLVITSGAQNALTIVLMTAFNRGDRIGVDALTYTGIRNMAIQLGLKLIVIEGDEEGMLPDALEDAVEEKQIKGLYIMPDCHNPTGLVMPLKRRQALAQMINHYGIMAIEDSIFRFTTDMTLPTLHGLVPEHCYHIASISKMINPGFRIGYLLVPRQELMARVEHTLHNLMFMPSPITGEMLSALQSSKKLEGLLEYRRRILKRNNEVFDTVFGDASFPTGETSMFRFIPLPSSKCQGLDLEALFLAEDIQVYSADRFRVTEEDGQTGIRLSVCPALKEQSLEETFKKIKRILDKVWC